jgi:hypothetical protein
MVSSALALARGATSRTLQHMGTFSWAEWLSGRPISRLLAFAAHGAALDQEDQAARALLVYFERLRRDST